FYVPHFIPFFLFFFSPRAYLSLHSFPTRRSSDLKLTLIIYLASVYSKKQKYINNFVRGVLPPLVVTVGMVGLIIMQPDIGTSSIILLVVATIIISSGVQLKHILFLFSL